jgi:succinate dehydrogenase / fumarate reductase cytochrome b subunit
MTVREIQSHLEEMYGTAVSPTLISSVTDAVVDEVKAWQARPLVCVRKLGFVYSKNVMSILIGHMLVKPPAWPFCFSRVPQRCSISGIQDKACLRFVMNKKRPKHLALHKIKLPLPGIVSILHRISGFLLFIALPLMLLMLQYSLNSIETYTELMSILALPLAKLMLLGLLWAFLHHFCAGLRYLAIDMHLVRDLAGARNSSKAVMVVSLALTVLLGVKLW